MTTSKKKYVTSFDNIKVAYQTLGSGKKAIVLCNGLGGSLKAWHPLYNNLTKDYKFISWDYRGLFSSDVPDSQKQLTLTHHAKDLKKILQKEKVSSAILTGWSMGVQVLLEFYNLYPKSCKALFMINGTYKTPFHSVFNSPLSRFIVPKANQLLKKFTPKIQTGLKALAKKAVAREDFIFILSKLGLVNERLDPKIMSEIVEDILQMDLTIFHDLLHYLNEHDASEILPKIQVPTLIVSGNNDKMTPSKIAEDMAAIIPNAEFLMINGGSHYTLLEFPDLVLQRLKQFLKEHQL